MTPSSSKTNLSQKRDSAHVVHQLRRELDHVVRALSHDMSANFMLLDDSFGRLRRSIGTSPPAQLAEMANHVDACLRETRRFLDDLVRLGKTGSVEMEPGRVELTSVVEEVLFELHELLDRRGIIVRVSQPLPSVWCNRQRVKQILSNLVRNAIHHGCDAAEPRITIHARPDETTRSSPTDYPMILLRVEDNGAGIPAEKAEEVFLPGRRLSGGSQEGSGMGLAIVRKIAEHYGGQAWVDTTAARGTAIVVSLPGVSTPQPGLQSRYPIVEHDGPHRGRHAPATHPHAFPHDRHNPHNGVVG